MSGSTDGRGSVLVISSSPDACRPFAAALAKLGYSVVVERDAVCRKRRGAIPVDLALQFVAQGEPLEFGCSERVGRASTRNPVGVVIEGGDPAVGLSALSAGAQFWLPHPIDPALLAGALDKAIARVRERGDLVREAQHARELIERVPVGVFEIGDGRVAYVNEYLVQVSKYSREELTGIRAEELVAPEDRERAEKALSKRHRGVKGGPGTYRLIAKDGAEHIVEIEARLLDSPGAARIQGTIRDITKELDSRHV